MTAPRPTGVSALVGMVPPPAAEAPAPARPAAGGLQGQEWDDFTIGELVGVGGMGEVYRAQQRSMARTVALKVLPAAVGDDPLLAQRFANEARAAAAVTSPHVVAVHACGRQHGRCWISMEFVAGGTLAGLLDRRRAERRPCTPPEAIAFALQAARGLAAAHAAGLVHRDIKPGNLMLAADGRLLVADFGLVKVVGQESLTLTGSTLGTPLYMAPEQARGDAVDAKSDLYALGCVLYELLTLRPPFTGDSAEVLVFQHNYAEPELPRALNPDVPQDLQAVVLKCLQKEPAERFADAAGLIADLERLGAGLAPRSAVFAPGRVGTGAAEALRRRAGRRRLWPWALAALALLAAGAALWWRWDAHKDELGAVRRRVAPLAQAQPPPATAEADLARLARLAGGEDPQVVQGRAKLAAVAALHTRLDALAGDDAASAAEAAAVAVRLAELAGEDDPPLRRWRERAVAREAALERLRAELAELDRGHPAPARRAAAAPRLERLERLAGAGDDGLRRWRALLAQAAADEAALRAVFAQPAGPAPGLDELVRRREAAQRLLALVPDDAEGGQELRRSQAALAALEREQAAVAALVAQEGDLPGAALDRLAAGLEALDRAGTAAAPRAQARQRLEAGRQAIAALAERCAALDAPRSLPPGLGEELARYEALVGFGDARAQAWRTRYSAIRALQERLEPLARPAAPPADAASDLARLAALVGSDDAQVAAGQAKLRRLDELRARLGAALDPAAPVPPWAADELARWEALAGDDDADARRWRAKLAEWVRLRDRLAGLGRVVVLDAAALAEAEAALAAATSLVGAAETADAAARLAALRGPPAPAWAAGRGHDRHGPWLLLRVGGAEQRLRWRPPGSYALGSPADEDGRDDDETPRVVAFERGQWLGEDECPQALWAAVTGAWPAARRGAGRPLEQVARAEAEDFCRRLGGLLPGCRARLPGADEWEAAVRGGAAGARGGLDPAAVVHQDGGRLGAQPAGGRARNPLGLGDGPGNLWEWVAGEERGLALVCGGGWADPLRACRAANRARVAPGIRSDQVGFRLAVEE